MWVWNKAFTTKPLEIQDNQIPLINGDDDKPHLHRTYGLWSLIAFGISGTAGSGIFVTTGMASHFYAGGAIPISVALAGIACLLDGLCYADVASKVPSAGSVYSYAFHYFGELPAFLMSAVLLLNYGMSGCATARGCANYFIALLNSSGISTPVLLGDIVLPWPFTNLFSVSLLPFLIILLCSMIASRGAEESASFTNFVSILNLSLMASVVIMGCFYFNPQNFQPIFLPEKGIPGVVEGAAIMMFCFLGFDAVSTLSEEAENPSKTIPAALLGTLLLVGLIYSLISIVLVGMVPPIQMDPDAAVSSAFLAVGYEWQALLVCVGAVMTSFSATFACIVGQSRVFYRMAKDGLWFSIFQELNQHGCPVKNISISAIFLSTAAATMNFDFMIRLISCGVLLSFSLVNAAVLKPRWPTTFSLRTFYNLVFGFNILSLATFFVGQNLTGSLQIATYAGGIVGLIVLGLPFAFCSTQEDSRSFDCPFVPWTPLLGTIFNAYLITSLKGTTFVETNVLLLGAGVLWMILNCTV